MTDLHLQDPIKHKGWLKELPKIEDWIFDEQLERIPGRMGNPRPGNILSIQDLPERVDLCDAMPPVGDQGDIGSCTGWSVHRYGIGYLRRTDKYRQDTDYSPLFGYYNGRVADGMEWEKIDAGAYIRDVVDTARTIGAAPESRWKYEKYAKNWARRPVASAFKSAELWKLGEHYKITSLFDFLRAIASGHPVVFGFIVHTGMSGPTFNRTGVLTMPVQGNKTVGGHAVCGGGFDRTQQVAWGPNSWSPEWAPQSPTGRPGYFTIPFKMLETRTLTDDMWALVSESEMTQ